ncbi:saccharopine dehydrogenase NADP-binding domain-containing protein [Streptomyces rishiriensis]|uniref:saccharopine dehydrogenase NADP-binding domain-containing protein n=1 Tax=Streptomyces rishiriensis TaxID=68264 RepID=UPI000D594955|nr:saccharopine dehydrogenase NADP-binding domain-containing protein [Streptomyces rishiriensis]
MTRGRSVVVVNALRKADVAVEKRRILLLGATGYTGRRVLRELLARGEKPTLVGRSRTKMLTLADRFEAELPVAEVDVTSSAHLTRLLGPSDVVVSTVGPFMQLGMATVRAAARAGARYFDSTGEGPFARRVLLELDSVAAARGATLVPAFGYDYVPGNLAGALALEQAGERASHVEIGYFITRSGRGSELRYRSTLRDSWDLTTGGTRQTLVAAAAEDGFAYRSPRPKASARLVDERAAKRVLTFRYAGVRRPAMTVPGTEHLGLPEVFPQLESVEVGMGWLGRWTRPVQIAAMLQAPLLRSAKVRAALTRWSGRLPGAHREPDTDGRSLVIAVARDGQGRPLATTALTGPDPYEMTGSLLAWGAVRAAAPDAVLKPGVHGPVAAFGLDTLRLGAAEAGVHEVDGALARR